jgi:hypothetical protein
MNDTITNALDDLETAAEYVERDGEAYDAKMIRASVDTLREELQDTDESPTLAHIEVDGSPGDVEEWHRLVKDNPLPGYEFVVSDTDTTVRSVMDREELVSDIAESVAEQMQTEQEELQE